MPQRAGAASSTGQMRIANDDDDAAVLKILSKCDVPPSLFVNPALGFKILWALKHLAAQARQRLRAAENKRKRPKKAKPWAGTKLLRSRLQFLGLRMTTIEGDGNCQFRACSDQLYGSQEYHANVRAAAVQYMREHADDFSCFCVDPGAFDRYLDQMLNGRRGKPIWGDELTLRAICNAVGCTIHVLTSQSGGSQTSWYLKYTPEQQKTSKHVFLAYISPAHYNAFGLAPAESTNASRKVKADTTRKEPGSKTQKVAAKRTRRR